MSFDWESLKEHSRYCTPGSVEGLVYTNIFPFRNVYRNHMSRRGSKADILNWSDNITILLYEMLRDQDDKR